MAEPVSPAAPLVTEASAERRVRALPLGHLSLEVGHLYFEDFAAGPDGLAGYFRDVAAWARGVTAAHAERLRAISPRITPRVSTCFLIDDYFGPSSTPARILPMLLEAAERGGLGIDYLVRESACAAVDDRAVARLVEGRIVADPSPRTDGSRPPVQETGWLSNGQRSPVAGAVEAMRAPVAWAPPAQNATTRHSVFVDVELWSESPGGRVWSCAFLAAVWQLLRLGALRDDGEPIVEPERWTPPYSEQWSRLPAVVQLNPDAAPFAAYRSLSIVPRRFLLTEQAVRTILEQVAVDDVAAGQAVDRAAREGIRLPREVTERIDYVFAGDPPSVSPAPAPRPTGP